MAEGRQRVINATVRCSALKRIGPADKIPATMQQNEDAYAHLVKQYEYCKARKLTELFYRLGERLISDRLFEDFAGELELRPAFRKESMRPHKLATHKAKST